MKRQDEPHDRDERQRHSAPDVDEPDPDDWKPFHTRVRLRRVATWMSRDSGPAAGDDDAQAGQERDEDNG